MMSKIRCLLLSLLLIAPAAFADTAGSVLFARGEVSAERQPPVPLAKGDAVLENDEVVTGDASRAQLEMLDGAKIALRPNSRLRIEEYAYTPPAAATVSTREDTAVMNLVKGGFRTITGAVGREDNDDYEVRTAVGVLGIRGTDYTAVFCNGDCDWVPGATPASPVPDGLYLGVSDGRIVFRTAARTIELRAGEYAFIPLNDPRPQRLDAPPAVLLEQNDLDFDVGRRGRNPQAPTGGDDDPALGFDATLGTRRAPDSSAPQRGDDTDGAPPGSAAPSQPTGATDDSGNTVDITGGAIPQPPPPPPPPTGPRSIAYSGDTGNLTAPLTGVGDNDNTQFLIDANGNLLRFETPFQSRTAADVAVFEINTSAVTDTGSDSVSFMRWGRWSGGAMRVSELASGNTTNIDLGAQSLHWIQGAPGQPPAIPVTGNATYQLIGNTQPTDNQGNVGVLGSASFQADFLNMLVTSTLTINIGGSTWIGNGNGTIGAQIGLPPHMFGGSYAVTIDGAAGGSGDFSGFFSGPGQTSDPSFPGGVGLTYRLSDPSGAITVSGAAAFGNP